MSYFTSYFGIFCVIKIRSLVITENNNTKNDNHTKNYIKCFYANTTSIKNKIYELQAKLYSEEIDIFILNETWLNDSVTNNLIAPNYNIYRKDRSDANKK